VRDQDRPVSEHAVVLSEATVVYGRVTAVGPLSLTIPAGQAVALVGPSGAGKTSLLKLLAGQLAPTAGEVVVGGRSLRRLPGRRELPRLVGLLPQQLDLVPQLSVKHNVQAGALGRWGVARSLAALLLPLEHPPARTAVERMGLGSRFEDRVAELSGGEQQRVALARLLVQDPALVLADEPVASLDPARADQLLDLLRTAAREDGRTLVTSLHDPELARRHVDRMIGLREGRIAFDLPPHRVTPDLLGSLYRLLTTVDRADTG
jgi:phosphonate transport system ATP-binding protein